MCHCFSMLANQMRRMRRMKVQNNVLFSAGSEITFSSSNYILKVIAIGVLVNV